MTLWERTLVVGIVTRAAMLVIAAAWLAALLALVGMDLSTLTASSALTDLATRAVRAAAACVPFAAAIASALTFRASAGQARLVSDMATGVRPMHVRRALWTAAALVLVVQLVLSSAAERIDTPMPLAAAAGLQGDGEATRWTPRVEAGSAPTYRFDTTTLDVVVEPPTATPASVRAGIALGSTSAVLTEGGPWVRALAAAALLVLAGYVMLLAPADRPFLGYAALLALVPCVALGGLVATIAVWRADPLASVIVAAWIGSLGVLVVGCDLGFCARGLRTYGSTTFD